jgi:hypothetical protein
MKDANIWLLELLLRSGSLLALPPHLRRQSQQSRLVCLSQSFFCIWSRKTTNNIRPTYPISFQRYTDTSTEATAFTDAEKAVVAAAIQAIAAAASASISPATRLSAGLSATGVTTLGQLIQSLQTALVALQAAAEINWTTS